MYMYETGDISADTLRAGLIRIADDLTGALNSLGYLTETTVKLI